MLNIRTLTVTTCRDTIPHQHTSSCGGLKDFIYSFNFQGRTFLVRACTNNLRYSFSLLTSDPRRARIIWCRMIRRSWTKIGFATNKDDGNSWATYRTHFFYPLGYIYIYLSKQRFRIRMRFSHLRGYIFQRIGGVESKCYENDMRFGIRHWP